MREDRRNFLKTFGIGSAAVVGLSGETEVVQADTTNPMPKPALAGNDFDKQQWEGPIRDVVSAVLYDRLDAAAMGSTIRFFDRGWTMGRGPEETNVQSAMRLDAPTLFKVDKIGVTFHLGTHPADVNTVLSRYKLYLWLGCKQYCEVPLVEAFGPPNGDPTAPFKTLYTLDLPIVIAYDHNFFLEMVGSYAAYKTGLTMWGVLHGQKARGVQ